MKATDRLVSLLLLSCAPLVAQFPEKAHARGTFSTEEAFLSVFTAPSLAGSPAGGGATATTAPKTQRQLGFGCGVMLDAPLNRDFSLGTAIIYNDRRLLVTQGNTAYNRRIPTVFLPVEARYWLTRNINFGAGLFGAFRIGQVQDEEANSTADEPTVYIGEHEKAEVGLTASAHFVIPFAKDSGVLIGARYLRGLTNASGTQAYSEHMDDIQFNSGLIFTL